MVGIRGDWLVHGCMKLGDVAEDDRVSLQTRDALSAMYNGERFALRMWPQQGFKNTIWWCEKAVAPFNASYFVAVDPRRGPALFAGITVEKGFEDPDEATRRAQARGRPVDEWLLAENWDWHRAVSSLPQIDGSLRSAVTALRKELYVWLEFGDDQRDSRYFVITEASLYQRGGFRSVPWEDVTEFVLRSRPLDWGQLFVARAFSLEECTPELEMLRLLEVFESLKSVRDLWRGVAFPAPAARRQSV